MDDIRTWIEFSASAVEALAVFVMLIVIAMATVRWLVNARQLTITAYQTYRIAVGKSILVGLELLVAADIIRTVALAATPRNVAILVVLVFIRTFLGWTMTLEVEGRWPWQSVNRDADAREAYETGQTFQEDAVSNTQK